MAIKDELDRYSIPAKLRVKIFQWGLTGMSATASILLWLLLRCAFGFSGKVEQLKNEQIEILVQREAHRETSKQIQQVRDTLAPQLDQVVSSIDTLQHVVSKLKK